MDQIPALLITLVVIISILALGGALSDSLVALIRRRVPGFSFESDTFILWALLILAAFATGAVVMYLLLRA